MKEVELNQAQKDVLATIQNIAYRMQYEKFKREDRKTLRQVIINLSKEFKNFN